MYFPYFFSRPPPKTVQREPFPLPENDRAKNFQAVCVLAACMPLYLSLQRIPVNMHKLTGGVDTATFACDIAATLAVLSCLQTKNYSCLT